jgi:hypothetical protein
MLRQPENFNQYWGVFAHDYVCTQKLKNVGFSVQIFTFIAWQCITCHNSQHVVLIIQAVTVCTYGLAGKNSNILNSGVSLFYIYFSIYEK